DELAVLDENRRRTWQELRDPVVARLNGPADEGEVDIVQVADVQLLPLHMPDAPRCHHIGARGAPPPRGKPAMLHTALDPYVRTRAMQGSPLPSGTRDAELPTCGPVKQFPVVGQFVCHCTPPAYYGGVQ